MPGGMLGLKFAAWLLWKEYLGAASSADGRTPGSLPGAPPARDRTGGGQRGCRVRAWQLAVVLGVSRVSERTGSGSRPGQQVDWVWEKPRERGTLRWAPSLAEPALVNSR